MKNSISRCPRSVLLLVALCTLMTTGQAGAADPFALNLPANPVPDRVSLKRSMPPNTKQVYADLDGPGCIQHIWITLKRPGRAVMINRKIVIRIFFDDATVPNVEAPIGDFFGVMHGADYYDINNQFLSVKAWSGYNSYFAMPFAKRARIELENGPEECPVYLQVDWQRYPGQEMKETRRFSAQWRREMPTQRYGKGFFMLDADGPGDLIGFVYGVRLIDNVDRWSHGGAENLYIDGQGDSPVYIRGIGGEDTFGTSYGGVLHPPESHLYAAMPYYTAEDTGEARSAQRVVGYRFFVQDPISFKQSIHMRFGAMENDISAMVYWYQSGVPRRFTNLPDWARMLPATELRGGATDLPLPDSGSWSIGPLQANADNAAIRRAVESGATAARPVSGEWIKQETYHGFADFGLIHRPQIKGVGTHHDGQAAEARAVIEAPADMTARITLSWDDQLVLRVGDRPPVDLGTQPHFRTREVEVPLKKGANPISITLGNSTGTNHGGWAFAFRAKAPDGTLLVPRAIPAN